MPKRSAPLEQLIIALDHLDLPGKQGDKIFKLLHTISKENEELRDFKKVEEVKQVISEGRIDPHSAAQRLAKLYSEACLRICIKPHADGVLEIVDQNEYVADKFRISPNRSMSWHDIKPKTIYKTQEEANTALLVTRMEYVIRYL